MGWKVSERKKYPSDLKLDARMIMGEKNAYPISCIFGLSISIEIVLSEASAVSSPDLDLFKKSG